jgi:hypothetical protein
MLGATRRYEINVFSRHVEEAMARVEAERKAAAERPSAAE